MRRFLVLVSALLVASCYQVDGETVPQSASIKVEGLKEGLYDRPDGVKVLVRWNQAERQYDVTAQGEGQNGGGKARATRVANQLYLVQYSDAARLTLLASVKGDDVVLLLPNKAVEQRLAKAHGVGIRPGPINALTGSVGSVLNFYKDVVASGEFAEGPKVAFIGEVPR